MDLQIFEKDGWNVRAVEKDGEPWFIAKDVCESIGTASKDLRKILDSDEVDTINHVDSLGRECEMLIIDESGLYSLILRSRKKDSKLFKKWVTREVLPSIRKTGGYSLKNAPALPNFKDPAEAARAWAHQYDMAVEAKKQLAIAEVEKQHAIDTKAEIGSRREATAMATASAATRKANKLEDELGKGKNWKSTKSISWALHHFANSRGMWMVLGKKLAGLSVELGYEVRKIEDERYGKVNSYHVDVIEKLRKRIVADDNMMGKYRK